MNSKGHTHDNCLRIRVPPILVASSSYFLRCPRKGVDLEADIPLVSDQALQLLPPLLRRPQRPQSAESSPRTMTPMRPRISSTFSPLDILTALSQQHKADHHRRYVKPSPTLQSSLIIDLL